MATTINPNMLDRQHMNPYIERQNQRNEEVSVSNKTTPRRVEQGNPTNHTKFVGLADLNLSKFVSIKIEQILDQTVTVSYEGWEEDSVGGVRVCFSTYDNDLLVKLITDLNKQGKAFKVNTIGTSHKVTIL